MQNSPGYTGSVNYILIGFSKGIKKSRIRETLNISTDADSSTDTEDYQQVSKVLSECMSPDIINRPGVAGAVL